MIIGALKWRLFLEHKLTLFLHGEIKIKNKKKDIATLKLKKKTYGQIKFKGGGGVVG